MEYLSDDLKDKIEASKINQIPSSKRVFDSIFNEIVLKKEDDVENDEDNLSTNENDDIFSF